MSFIGREAEVSRICQGEAWYVLFSKSGFAQPLRSRRSMTGI